MVYTRRTLGSGSPLRNRSGRPGFRIESGSRRMSLTPLNTRSQTCLRFSGRLRVSGRNQDKCVSREREDPEEGNLKRGCGSRT